MAKKEKKACPWCGTAYRKRAGCPRGPACAAEQANHEALTERIGDQRRKK